MFSGAFSGSDRPSPRPPPYGGRPKYVKLAPGDYGDFLDPVFFEDPRTFKGKPGPKGHVVQWGLVPVDDENQPDMDIMTLMTRKSVSQFKYMPLGAPKITTPEEQFLDVLKERKMKVLDATDLCGRDKQDVILRATLLNVTKNGEHRVWRRFRVCAGVKLSVFQDKVLTPIMGWTRNLHAYIFTDYRDGALFGPEGMSSVDHLTWLSAVGHGYISDDRYTLAHLFEKEHDVFGYLYDFGDKWFHEIKVEKIIPTDESTGRVEILEGQGMCPGENMKGSWCFQDFMQDYDKADAMARFQKSAEILQQANYKDFGKPLLLFDPERFDMQHATRCLKEALASHNSVRQGAKGFKMPMSGTPDEIDAMDGIRLKKGQSFKRTSTDSFGYWQEAQTSRKDKKGQTICAECGKPGVDLKACGACRQIWYCSVDHQRVHWKQMHKRQCSKVFSQK